MPGLTYRFACILLLVTLLGCEQDVRSQQSAAPAPAPQRVDAPREAADEAVGRSRQTAITRAVEAATPAVVSVNVIEVQRVRYRSPFSDPFFEQFFGRQRSRVMERQVQGVGSGFVLSPDGYVVTNDHVAGNATKITVSFPDGQTYDATLVGSDPATDLALLKVEAEQDLPYLAFSTAGAPLVGEWAIALGNPFGLFEATDPTVTVGVVSAVGRDLDSGRNGYIYRDMIQTDAAINQGNSGGPLLNAVGEVIGVNTAIYSETGGSVGLGFAVPAAKAQRIIDELRTAGAVDRSYYVGLYGRTVDERMAEALDLPAPRGVFVRDFDPGSPAAEAGFAPYDVIVAVEGERVDDQDDFRAVLYDYRPGDRLRVEVVRDGEPRTLVMQIGRQEH